MSAEENKLLLDRLFEGMNQGDFSEFDELIGPDYVNHSFPTPVSGPEAVKMTLGMFLNAFPDMEMTVEDIIAEGNRVASRGFFVGTHEGEFNGIPATGRRVKVDFSDIWVVNNGQLAENWAQLDIMGMMQQLGVIPGPEDH